MHWVILFISLSFVFCAGFLFGRKELDDLKDGFTTCYRQFGEKECWKLFNLSEIEDLKKGHRHCEITKNGRICWRLVLEKRK